MKCAPSAALAPFVEHYWVTRWDRRGQPARAAASLLDPCVHLQVSDGRAEVLGVLRRPLAMRIAERGSVVGAKFRPGGFFPFVQRAVSAFTDRVAPAGEVFGAADGDAWARALSRAVAECEGDAGAHAALIAAHLDAYLLPRLPARDAVAEEVSALVAQIAADARIRRMGDLADASGRSERTLQRLFARYAGVSPAWVIRRYRLQAAAARLTAPVPAEVAEVAWEAGYADQAHFIRDFRATIGVTPGVYAQAAASRRR